MTLYETIYQDLKQRILNGEFSGGKQLPAELELQRQYNVSRITVKQAYEKLSKEYSLQRIRGKGTLLEYPQKNNVAKLIGLVLCDFDSVFGERLLKSIELAADKAGYSIIIKRSLDNHQAESLILSELKAVGVQGILIQNCHGNFTKKLIQLSLEEFPVISIDRYARGLMIPCVTSDNFMASQRAAQYLLQKGHRKILLASANPHSTSTLTDRAEGFKQAHINCGVSMSASCLAANLTSPVTRLPADIQNDIHFIAERLKSTDITAILATEHFAAELCAQAIAKNGCTIPKDYELICFDCETNFLSESRYTYIAQNEEEMGKQAVEKLLALIRNETTAARSEISTKLIFGKSTRS